MAEHCSNDDEGCSLLLALRSEDDLDGSFQALYREYRHRLLGFFSKRGFDAETCRDLSQETFFRVYRGRKSFRGDVPLASWIFQIAANLAHNEWRRRQAEKRKGIEKSLDDENESQPIELYTWGGASLTAGQAQPLVRTLAREKVEALGHALDQLPPRMKQTWQMWVHHEYSIKEIATVMNVSESTVKVQLHEGRKRLHQALADRFGELPF